MSDTTILQSILDGQHDIKKNIEDVKKELKKTDTKLTKRIGKVGIQLAELSDDSPTIEEFDVLESRVGKIEKKVALA